MALSCLPAEQIVPVFNLLKQEVNNINPLSLRKSIRIWHNLYFDRYSLIWILGLNVVMCIFNACVFLMTVTLIFN